jgi:hypothetical protein
MSISTNIYIHMSTHARIHVHIHRSKHTHTHAQATAMRLRLKTNEKLVYNICQAMLGMGTLQATLGITTLLNHVPVTLGSLHQVCVCKSVSVCVDGCVHVREYNESLYAFFDSIHTHTLSCIRHITHHTPHTSHHPGWQHDAFLHLFIPIACGQSPQGRQQPRKAD